MANQFCPQFQREGRCQTAACPFVHELEVDAPACLEAGDTLLSQFFVRDDGARDFVVDATDKKTLRDVMRPGVVLSRIDYQIVVAKILHGRPRYTNTLAAAFMPISSPPPAEEDESELYTSHIPADSVVKCIQLQCFDVRAQAVNREGQLVNVVSRALDDSGQPCQLSPASLQRLLRRVQELLVLGDGLAKVLQARRKAAKKKKKKSVADAADAKDKKTQEDDDDEEPDPSAAKPTASGAGSATSDTAKPAAAAGAAPSAVPAAGGGSGKRTKSGCFTQFAGPFSLFCFLLRHLTMFTSALADFAPSGCANLLAACLLIVAFQRVMMRCLRARARSCWHSQVWLELRRAECKALLMQALTTSRSRRETTPQAACTARRAFKVRHLF